MTAGLGWMIIAGWYQTPSFSGAQLFGERPSDPGVYAELALTLGDALFWFAVFGALAFWLVIPAGRKLRAEIESRSG
ncbi:putative membrane protein [Halapricum desulfuricans]|uniref:Putative membrane protein n=2 Tax=Halapricum desulfuricans TaxID=2841257 RepID=A0A897N302_9EURY|nr:putative membrane protein [Halapricum desulfuricans]